MAMSSDGFLCKNETDDMRWTGGLDKFIFRILTMSDNVPIYAGQTTFSMMPTIAGRRVTALRSDRAKGITVLDAYQHFPNAWLIGGPTTAAAALGLGLIDRIIINRCEAILCDGYRAEDVINKIPPFWPNYQFGYPSEKLITNIWVKPPASRTEVIS